MARFTSQVNVGENLNVTYKAVGAVTDNDVNKPVYLSAADTVTLCADGKAIYGFINSVERATADGKVLVGVQIAGRRKVTLDGESLVGTLVEAAANPAVGVVLTSNWGLVATKSAVAADLAIDANGTLIAASVNALLAEALLPVKQWMVISGTGLDEADVLIELQ
jgi:hypothetical protein